MGVKYVTRDGSFTIRYFLYTVVLVAGDWSDRGVESCDSPPRRRRVEQRVYPVKLGNSEEVHLNYESARPLEGSGNFAW